MKDIIVAEEKHETVYYDASTPEAWARSALRILTRRWKDGYWYYDPSEVSEYGEKRQTEYDRALALDDAALDALPDTARKQITHLRLAARREQLRNKEAQAWYDEAKRVVEEQDAGFQTVGRNKYAREVPKAWVLLDARSDHEYERVSLEELA